MLVERRGDDVRIHPARDVDATLRLPGSKSLTNRYLACAALADGTTTLLGGSLSDDAQRMIAGLRQLGVAVELREDAEHIDVHGVGGRFTTEDVRIDAGNAGTAMRFLTALACLGNGRIQLDGSPRMRQRPIGPLVGALQQLGAGVGYEGQPEHPPLTITARGLTGGNVTFDRTPSSQFVSAILMIAPYAMQDVMIRIAGELTSKPYVEMTLAVMRALGVESLASDDFDRLIVPAPQRYAAGDATIEPDASAATYFWAVAAITGGRARVLNLGRTSLQGDARFVNVLEQMGCAVERGDEFLEVRGPERGALRGVDVDLNAMPDTAQTLAVTALFARGLTRVRNVANLRIKETDRLAALHTELTRLGAKVTLHDDGLTVEPPTALRPATIETYDDHRMAMSCALAGLISPGVVIRDADCVRKSFPSFFEVFDAIGRRA